VVQWIGINPADGQISAVNVLPLAGSTMGEQWIWVLARRLADHVYQPKAIARLSNAAKNDSKKHPVLQESFYLLNSRIVM
jgi:hypothetical protein